MKSKLEHVVQEFTGSRRTDEECWECENGTMHRLGNEIVCDNCYFSPDGESHPSDVDDPWELFWEERESDDHTHGFVGEDRIRMVGGFPYPYFD